MHEGINRPDGRHWCAPDSAEDEGVTLVECSCGQVWHYVPMARTWVKDSDVYLESPPPAPSRPEPVEISTEEAEV